MKSNKTKTAKKAKPTKSQLSTETLIKSINEAIDFKFPKDMTAPGLLISKLRNGKAYVSVNRFKGPFGQDKEVVCASTQNSLADALKDVAAQIVADDTIARTPVDELRDQLGL